MNARLVLSLDAAIFLLWMVATLVGSWSLFYLGFLIVGVIVWLEGGLRFPRVRRWSLELVRTIGQLARLRRPSNTALRHLATVAGVIVLIIVLNQLSLAAPGRGHGLSVPTEGLTLDFSFSSTGGTLVTVFWISVILALAVSIFARLWQPIGALGDPWRTRTFIACASLFVLLPAAYSIAALFAPDDPKESVTYAKVLMRTMLSILTIAFTLIVALPLIRAPAAPTMRPTPSAVPPRP
jgi:hypothetical protein